MKVEIICPQCGKKVMKEASHINRSRSINAPVYCGRICSGLGRRNNKTIEQKKEDKRLYDIEYRDKNREKLKESKKRYYFGSSHETILARNSIYRKKNMSRHVEYCRDPEYRAKKQSYDRVRRAKIQFGEFWEASLYLIDIDTEIESRITKNEIRSLNGTQNKSQQRKRMDGRN